MTKHMLTYQEEQAETLKRHEAEYELFKNTVKDARYVLKQYGASHPADALEALRKILFNPKLHLK